MYYYRGQVSLAFCQSRKGNPCRELKTRPWLSDWSQASAVVVNAVALRGAATSAPLVVGLDGRSGSGKSTLDCLVAEKTDAVVLSADDFYSAHISDVEWDLMSVEERWSKVFNWAKFRSEAVVPLLGGRPARWHQIDFDAGPDRQGRYGMKTESKRAEPASVIIFDGVYSSGPQIADLVGLSILVEAPDVTRRTRLARREEPKFLAQWHARWDAVEDFYFSSVRPRESFDVIVTV